MKTLSYCHIEIQPYIIQEIKHYRARVLDAGDWIFETQPNETLDEFRARIMLELECGIITHFIEEWKIS